MDLVGKLRTLLCNGTLHAELDAALTFCTTLLTQAPYTNVEARSAADRPSKELQAFARESSDGCKPCLFAGALGMLELRKRANSVTDLARMRWALSRLTTTDGVSQVLNQVVVNASAWTYEEKTALQRGSHDAEVDAVVLTLYWCQSSDAFPVLCNATRDLVFSCEDVGLGTQGRVSHFLRMELAEEKRDVIGHSAARKCGALSELLGQARQERIGLGKGDVEVVVDLLGSRKELAATWNKETVRRYLAVGKRLTSETVQNLIERWEFAFSRRTLIDGMMTLRAAASAAGTDEEFEYLLNSLFWEQSCGIRKSMKGRSVDRNAVDVFRGILLRRHLFAHCVLAFPEHASSIDEFGTYKFYSRRFGM